MRSPWFALVLAVVLACTACDGGDDANHTGDSGGHPAVIEDRTFGRSATNEGDVADADAPRPEPDDESPTVVQRPTPAEVLPIQVDTRTREDIRAEVAADTSLLKAQLGPWDQIMFGRFVAIDDMVAHYAGYYGNDYLWTLMIYCSESVMDPLAKGPDTDGDRGLGQVSLDSGTTAREWASDPSNEYYLPGFRADGNVWDPETNIILSAIGLRSFYAVPTIDSNQEAYGHYTVGLAAADGNGGLIEKASSRVARAASFESTIRSYVAAKYAVRGGENSRPTEILQSRHASVQRILLSKVTDPVVRRMLAVDQQYTDGAPAYLALRDMYLELAADPAYGAWPHALYLGEALTFTRLAALVYDTPGDTKIAAIGKILQTGRPAALATGDGDLIAFYDNLIAEAETALG